MHLSSRLRLGFLLVSGPQFPQCKRHEFKATLALETCVLRLHCVSATWRASWCGHLLSRWMGPEHLCVLLTCFQGTWTDAVGLETTPGELLHLTSLASVSKRHMERTQIIQKTGQGLDNGCMVLALLGCQLHYI